MTGDGAEEIQIRRPALLFVLAMAFVQDSLHGLIFLSAMNHYLLDVLEASPGLPGYTLSLYGGTKLLVHPIAGRLLDRTSPRLVFVLVAGMQVAGAGVLLSWQSLAGFLFATVLLAIGSAGMWPLVYEAVARTQEPGARTRVTGLMAIAGYLATGTGFGLGVLLSDLAPLRAIFLLALAVAAFPLVFFRSGVLATGKDAASETTQAPDRPGARRHATRALVIFGVVVLLDYSAISSLAGIYGPYVRLTLDITLLHAVALLAPAGLVALGALSVAARYSRPGRRFREMALLYGASAAGALGLALTTTPWVASLAAIPLAVGAGGVGPIVAASVIDLSGERGRGTVIGSLMSVEGLGSVAGPALVALVVDLVSLRSAFACIAATFALLVILTSLAPRPEVRELVRDSPD